MVDFPHAGRWGPEIFMDANQVLMKSKQITVYETGTSTLATLYTSRTKAVTAANPFTTDARGNGSFFANPGEYDIAYAGHEFTITVPIDFEDLAVGVPAGYPFVWSTNTADTDPGSGGMKGNNATIASMTFLYVDDVTTTSINVAVILASLDDSTNTIKALVELKSSDGSSLHKFKVTGSVVDGGTYTKIPVTHVGGTGTFDASEVVYLTVMPIGDAGFSPVRLTESEYAALDPPDPETWYVIVEDP